MSSTSISTSFTHPFSAATTFVGGSDKDASLAALTSPRATATSSSPSSFDFGATRSWKSTMASVDYYYDDADEDIDIDEINRSRGHAEAAEARATSHLSHDESWMINLGRDGDNEWLLGPRPDDWFTGMKPGVCPGKFQTCRRFFFRFLNNLAFNEASTMKGSILC